MRSLTIIERPVGPMCRFGSLSGPRRPVAITRRPYSEPEGTSYGSIGKPVSPLITGQRNTEGAGCILAILLFRMLPRAALARGVNHVLLVTLITSVPPVFLIRASFLVAEDAGQWCQVR